MYFAIYPAKFGLNTLWNHLLRKLDIEDSLNPKEDTEIKEDPLAGVGGFGGGFFIVFPKQLLCDFSNLNTRN